ncbi:MAG: hypothetical protein ACI9XC_000058 [Gammaproteobacteria bacterium]|jgi:hypothetical protein
MKHRHLFTCFRLIGLSLVMALVGNNVIAQTYPSEVMRFADSVYVNATIVTLDDHEMNSNPGTIVQAMAIRDEMIMALGSTDEMMRMAGPDTEIIDLQGKTVLPGIVESHVHPMGAAERNAREIYNLRNSPEGYALDMDVAASSDETMANVAEAMQLLLSIVQPGPDEWINISIVHNPELGFATPADVSTLMSAPRLVDVQITKEDLSEIVPNYPFVLSSATSILSAPEKNVWYHITVGPNGQPVEEKVIDLP